MTPREIVRRTLEYNKPPRVPRQLWLLPWANIHHPEMIAKLARDFPDDIVTSPQFLRQKPRTSGKEHDPGEYIDEWGCRFTNLQRGIIGIVNQPRIYDWSDLDGFYPPFETLTVDIDEVNAFCRSTDRFVLAGNCPRPFERFQFLRTTEHALVDLLCDEPEMERLLDMIHQHYMRELEIWCQTDVDAISFMDDWGSQNALLVSPDLFRKYFLGYYQEYCAIARQHGKYVFMHSDGYIADIIPDLIGAGVNALNSQLFCMNIEEIGKLYRGKLTFWGEIDRQNLLPNGSEAEIRSAVRHVRENLWANGGCIAQCEFGADAKPKNVWAVFDEWAKQ